MQSQSTTDKAFRSVLASQSNDVTFGEAVLAGWSEDGGMFWPTNLQPVSRDVAILGTVDLS